MGQYKMCGRNLSLPHILLNSEGPYIFVLSPTPTSYPGGDARHKAGPSDIAVSKGPQHFATASAKPVSACVHWQASSSEEYRRGARDGSPERVTFH